LFKVKVVIKVMPNINGPASLHGLKIKSSTSFSWIK